MRSLRDYIGQRSDGDQETPLDDKTVFFLFRKIIKEEYGIRGVAELEPVAYLDGVLSVKPSNPLYSSELWIRREQIIDRMNVALERDVIREIRLVRYTA